MAVRVIDNFVDIGLVAFVDLASFEVDYSLAQGNQALVGSPFVERKLAIQTPADQVSVDQALVGPVLADLASSDFLSSLGVFPSWEYCPSLVCYPLASVDHCFPSSKLTLTLMFEHILLQMRCIMHCLRMAID